MTPRQEAVHRAARGLWQFLRAVPSLREGPEYSSPVIVWTGRVLWEMRIRWSFRWRRGKLVRSGGAAIKVTPRDEPKRCRFYERVRMEHVGVAGVQAAVEKLWLKMEKGIPNDARQN